jgi:hypothetical protein
MGNKKLIIIIIIIIIGAHALWAEKLAKKYTVGNFPRKIRGNTLLEA